ncbi:MAG TPA: carbamoyltransferase HypF [Methylocystis sp.]|nr:carbamoyltransferase HypF [Methylocystis sp.]
MKPALSQSEASERLRVRVRGAVQGVGFRPFVHGLAHALDLGGFVRNDSEGVLLEIEGGGAREFVAALRRNPPPLARIDAVEEQRVAPRAERQFFIETSLSGETRTRIPADAALCEACLDELFEPRSRFYLYPFVNCTHCGPRYTLTRRLPFDRCETAMAPFAMCEACATDFRDLSSRRFHAQTIACPHCGPQLDASIDEIAARLRNGGIVALKGVGGFHLLCDARNEKAVRELRRRKQRDAKPFAVMVLNAASAGRIGAFGESARALLCSPARPIVVVEKREALAPSVAPGLSRIGAMLAYTPTHYLIFHALAGGPEGSAWREAPLGHALVATSANMSGEPLIVDDAEAREKLSRVADLIVGFDREIVARTDDSVMSLIAGAPAFLRRARGFVPEPIALSSDGPDTLALGAHLKTSVTVTRGREAFVSTYIGSLSDAATARHHAETVARMLDILDVRPECVACDLHPDLHTTRIAEASGLPVFRAQHHAAHVAAILAEHGVEEPSLGVALDGFGYGDDGGAWGGELIRIEGAGWRRIGHLAPTPSPGGDRTARSPWRMGVGMLAHLGRGAEAETFFPEQPLAGAVAQLASSPGVSRTTSLGRLFDTAAALLGLRLEQDYEGQAAMELEALCRAPRTLPGGFALQDGVLDLSPLFRYLVGEKPSKVEGAELFHGTLIEALAAWIMDSARRFDRRRVALGGGCFMNAVLAEGLALELQKAELEPLLARRVPSNDGGLSLGQAYLARRATPAGWER